MTKASICPSPGCRPATTEPPPIAASHRRFVSKLQRAKRTARFASRITRTITTVIVANKLSCKRRVVIVEYDVTHLSQEQVDALLFGALASCQDVSFKIEITPGSPGSANTSLTPREQPCRS